MGDHPVCGLLQLLVISLMAGYFVDTSPPLAAITAALTLRSIQTAINSIHDPDSAHKHTKMLLLVLLCLLMPGTAAAVALAPYPSLASIASFHLAIPSMLNAAFIAFLPLVLALFITLRKELPTYLVISLTAAVAAAGVAATGYMLSKLRAEDISWGLAEDAIRSGFAAVATVLGLALCLLCAGLHLGRNTLKFRVLRWSFSVLFLVCLAAAATAHATIDESSDRLLQLLRSVSYVACVGSALPLPSVYYLSYQKSAIRFGYTSNTAMATAVCRILIRFFSLCCLVSSFLFGFSFDWHPVWPMLAFVALMTAQGAMHGALAYVRYKEPPLRKLPMGAFSIFLAIFAAVVVGAEIAHIVLCGLWWPAALPPLYLGALCLSAHSLHALLGYVLDRMRPVLRPIQLPLGLILTAVASSLTLYGELTQFFPTQERSPTVWLAVSLAASAAVQLLVIPAVEGIKLEVAMEKQQREERSSAFRVITRQRLLDKRFEKQVAAEAKTKKAELKAEAKAKKAAEKAAARDEEQSAPTLPVTEEDEEDDAADDDLLTAEEISEPQSPSKKSAVDSGRSSSRSSMVVVHQSDQQWMKYFPFFFFEDNDETPTNADADVVDDENEPSTAGAKKDGGTATSMCVTKKRASIGTLKEEEKSEKGEEGTWTLVTRKRTRRARNAREKVEEAVTMILTPKCVSEMNEKGVSTGSNKEKNEEKEEATDDILLIFGTPHLPKKKRERRTLIGSTKGEKKEKEMEAAVREEQVKEMAGGTAVMALAKDPEPQLVTPCPEPMPEPDAPLWQFDPTSMAESPEEELMLLRRKEARLMMEEGTVNNRIDRMFPDLASGSFVYTSHRHREMLESEKNEIAVMIEEGKTTREEREEAAAKKRHELTEDIKDRLRQVQQWKWIANIFAKDPIGDSTYASENQQCRKGESSEKKTPILRRQHA